MKNGACPNFAPRRAADLEALRDERLACCLNGAAADVHPVRERVDVVVGPPTAVATVTLTPPPPETATGSPCGEDEDEDDTLADDDGGVTITSDDFDMSRGTSAWSFGSKSRAR